MTGVVQGANTIQIDANGIKWVCPKMVVPTKHPRSMAIMNKETARLWRVHHLWTKPNGDLETPGAVLQNRLRLWDRFGENDLRSSVARPSRNPTQHAFQTMTPGALRMEKRQVFPDVPKV